MIKTSTQTNVVKYLYDETTEQEHELMATQVLVDDELGAFYHELKELKDELSELKAYPPRNVIDNILNYSKSINLRAVVN